MVPRKLFAIKSYSRKRAPLFAFPYIALLVARRPLGRLHYTISKLFSLSHTVAITRTELRKCARALRAMHTERLLICTRDTFASGRCVHSETHTIAKGIL